MYRHFKDRGWFSRTCFRSQRQPGWETRNLASVKHICKCQKHNFTLDTLFVIENGPNILIIVHREKEVPELRPRNGSCGVVARRKLSAVKNKDSTRQRRATSDDAPNGNNGDDENVYDLPAGEDYLAIYETLDRVKKKADCHYGYGIGMAGSASKSELKSKSHSMEALETPTPSLKSFEFPDNDHLSQQQKAEPQQPSQVRRRGMRDAKKIKIRLHSYFFCSCGLVGFAKSLFASSM